MTDLEQHDWPDEVRYHPGRHRAHRDGPVRLVVLGDSFAFTDEHGPQLPDAPQLWPNVAAGVVAEGLATPVTVEVLARPAQTARDALALVRKDRHAQFEVLAHADAVVVAIGSYDHAPMGVPSAAWALVDFVRPPGLRRRVRRVLHAAYPVVVRATGSRLARTAASAFERDFAAVLAHLRGVAHGAAGVVVGPASHRSTYYGHAHPRHARRETLTEELAVGDGWGWVAAWPLVEPSADALNEDGIHWPATAHAAVGAAVGEAVLAQLSGAAPRPPRPGRDD